MLERLIISSPIQLIDSFTATCTAGSYVTEGGCVECGANTYSGDAATECTSCPEGKLSAAGSTSEAYCRYGL